MSEVLHDVYLPFTEAQLREHFAPVGADKTSADRHLDYYRKSVQAARDWASSPPSGTPAEQAQAKRRGLQMQKDERFWIVTALMSVFHAPDRVAALAALLRRCLGDVPPLDGLATWEQALGDAEKLRLFFEVSLPTPPEYRQELRQQLEQRVLIPHVLESARKAAAAGHALEGATKVDAMLIAPETGFAVLFEAKVLADASCSIGFDVLRNQLARNIDVMLQPNPNLEKPLTTAAPRAVLLRAPHARDLPQPPGKPPVRLADARLPAAVLLPCSVTCPTVTDAGTDLAAVASRLGWLTWEDCNEVLPGACPWLPGNLATC